MAAPIPETRTKGQPDLISQGVGSERYVTPWYPEALRVAIHGIYRKEAVRLSRYYMDLKPPVVVDFEPDPRDERWYIDEKRRWCVEQGIVYVPIYLADELSLEAFVSRLKDCRALAKAGRKALADQEAREALAKQAPITANPEVMRWVEQEARRRLIENDRTGVEKKQIGFMQTRQIKRLTQTIVKELQEKYPDGRVGPECRAHVTPDAARR